MATEKRRSTRNKKPADKEPNKGDKTLCLSRNVIVESVCCKSLIDCSVDATLPQQLHSIYQLMMNDLSFINESQTRKDCSFYHSNMGFFGAENMVKVKRKVTIESLEGDFGVWKRRRKDATEDEIPKNVKRKVKKIEEVIRESVTKLRPNRKRKAPVKFEDEVSEERKEKIVVATPQFIDLSADDGKDDATSPTTKIYFREPSQRRPCTSGGSKLKEHTLLDKIMLGINCVRQWTDKGLQLTKLGDNDLGLLNKRLASVKCTMTDLAEHTDENNNKTLSVLIQSEMFTGPRVVEERGTSVCSGGGGGDTSTSTTTRDPSMMMTMTTHTRHKSHKTHITAMYRQRHTLPSILSRPTLTASHRQRPKTDNAPRFSAVKTEPDTALPPAQPLSVTDHQASDPCMSASRLLRLKSQSSAPVATTPPPTSVLALEQPRPGPTTVTTATRLSTVIYQTMPINNYALPLFMSPHNPVSMVRVPSRTFRIPLSQTSVADSIRFHHNNVHYQSLPRMTSPSTTSCTATSVNTHMRPSVGTITRLDHTHGNQSTILKNLLQQSHHNPRTAPANGRVNISSSRHMVPLSVFQSNNNNNWQLGPIAQVHLKK